MRPLWRFPALAVTSLALLLLVTAPAGRAAAPRAVECFPVVAWHAAAQDRPCHRLGPVGEDGSGVLFLGTRGRRMIRCVLPALTDRPIRVKCRRVPR